MVKQVVMLSGYSWLKKKTCFFSIICWKIEEPVGFFTGSREFPSLKMKIIWIMFLFIYDANSALPVCVTLPMQVWKTEQLADSQQMCANKTVHASFFLNSLVRCIKVAFSLSALQQGHFDWFFVQQRSAWGTGLVLSLRWVWGLSQGLNSPSSCEWAANTSRANHHFSGMAASSNKSGT